MNIYSRGCRIVITSTRIVAQAQIEQVMSTVNKANLIGRGCGPSPATGSQSATEIRLSFTP